MNLDEVGGAVFNESWTDKWSGGAVVNPRKINVTLEQAGHPVAGLVQSGGKSAPANQHFDFSDEPIYPRNGRIGVESENVELDFWMRIGRCPCQADGLHLANGIEIIKRLLEECL